MKRLAPKVKPKDFDDNQVKSAKDLDRNVGLYHSCLARAGACDRVWKLFRTQTLAGLKPSEKAYWADNPDKLRAPLRAVPTPAAPSSPPRPKPAWHPLARYSLLRYGERRRTVAPIQKQGQEEPGRDERARSPCRMDIALQGLPSEEIARGKVRFGPVGGRVRRVRDQPLGLRAARTPRGQRRADRRVRAVHRRRGQIVLLRAKCTGDTAITDREARAAIVRCPSRRVHQDDPDDGREGEGPDRAHPVLAVPAAQSSDEGSSPLEEP